MNEYDRINELRLESIDALQKTDFYPVPAIAGRICEAHKAGKKIIICGNGGSCADASHFAAELCGRFTKVRMGLPAIAITDAAAITAISNDYGFDNVFKRHIQALGEPDDILIAITTSGSSENIVRALSAADEIGMTCVLLTGPGGNHLMAYVWASIVAASPITARIQEVHGFVIHAICELVDEMMGA